MTNHELEKLVDKLYRKFKGTPGVDPELIRKLLNGISAINDQETEETLLKLLNRL